MSEPATTTTEEGSLLWTLEEISHLVSRGGNAAETLTNIVQLIQRRFATDVCSVYLLEADRSTLVLAATIGLRPESVGRVRMRLTEGLAGLVGQQLRPLVVEDATRHPRFKYFGEAGEDPYHSFLGVPVIDRGLLQGVLIVQTREPRAFAQDVVRMLMTAGAQLAPIVARSAHAAAVRRARASAAVGAGAQSLVELGRNRDQPVPRHRPGAVARGRPQSGGAAPADSRRHAGRTRVAARAAQPHQSRLPAHAGIPVLGAHLGRAPRRRAVGAAGRVFLGGIRLPRVDPDLLGRPGHPRRRSRQGGVRPRHPARRDRALLRSGLLPSAPRSRRPAARGLHRRRQPVTSDRAGDGDRGRRADHALRSTRAPDASTPASGSSPSAATRSI